MQSKYQPSNCFLSPTPQRFLPLLPLSSSSRMEKGKKTTFEAYTPKEKLMSINSYLYCILPSCLSFRFCSFSFINFNQ